VRPSCTPLKPDTTSTPSKQCSNPDLPQCYQNRPREPLLFKSFFHATGPLPWKRQPAALHSTSAAYSSWACCYPALQANPTGRCGEHIFTIYNLVKIHLEYWNHSKYQPQVSSDPALRTATQDAPVPNRYLMRARFGAIPHSLG